MAEQTEDDFRAAGERTSVLRREAYASYSRAADLVRERLMALDTAIRIGTPPERDRAEAVLSVAARMKELTERELSHADANWREWVEEARARREEQRLRRQEKATTSAAWAAWFAAVAAVASAVATGWEIVHRIPGGAD